MPTVSADIFRDVVKPLRTPQALFTSSVPSRRTPGPKRGPNTTKPSHSLRPFVVGFITTRYGRMQVRKVSDGQLNSAEQIPLRLKKRFRVCLLALAVAKRSVKGCGFCGVDRCQAGPVYLTSQKECARLPCWAITTSTSPKKTMSLFPFFAITSIVTMVLACSVTAVSGGWISFGLLMNHHWFHAWSYSG